MTKDYRMVDRAPGQALMTVRASTIERVVCFDPDPDLSYLDPDADPDYAAENAERLAAYRAGDWACLGIKAKASFLIGLGEAAIIQTVESPGLWGIESDSDAGYLSEVFGEETGILRDLLHQLGVAVIDG